MLNIYQRINEVRKKVAYVQKDKHVGSGGWGYKAVTHDMVTAILRPHLIEQGIVVVPSLVFGQVVLTGTTTSKGIPYIRFEAVYNVRLVNADAPAEFVEVQVAAHALDDADKAPGKAASYATKVALLKVFSIETGEDDEGRMPQHEEVEEEAPVEEVPPPKAKKEVAEAPVEAEVDPRIAPVFKAISAAANKAALEEARSNGYALATELKDRGLYADVRKRALARFEQLK